MKIPDESVQIGRNAQASDAALECRWLRHCSAKKPGECIAETDHRQAVGQTQSRVSTAVDRKKRRGNLFTRDSRRDDTQLQEASP